MRPKRNVILAGVAVLAVAGLSTGVAVATSGAPAQPAATTSPAASGTAAGPAAYTASGYSWYRSMMSGYYGSGSGMMGGSSHGWMMSQVGYAWMTGGAGAPGWMRGGALPASMMSGADGTDPAISVPPGAHVTIEVVNADTDMAHGLVIMPAGTASSYMPMMTAAPAFTTSALWFLGKPTAAGMHAGTIAFTAARSGSYQYLCPVPGHAREGMADTFTVR